jgi:hypothetical protein
VQSSNHRRLLTSFPNVFLIAVLWFDGPSFGSQWEQETFLFSKTYRSALGPPRLLFSGYRHSFPRLKLRGREDNRSPPSTVEVKNDWNYASTPNTSLCPGQEKLYALRGGCNVVMPHSTLLILASIIVYSVFLCLHGKEMLSLDHMYKDCVR